MIVDKSGRMFEDRRKKNSDRRKVDKGVSVDKRKGERRKSKIRKIKKNKKVGEN